MNNLSYINKIGNSLENIIEVYNVLNNEDWNKISQECKSLEYNSGSDDPDNFWYKRIAGSDELSIELSNILKNIFIIAKTKAESYYGIKLKGKQNYNITVWRPAMSMHAHIDDADYKDYNIAALFYINEDYQGGEINFINFDKKFKPRSNSLIIFPGHDAYLHEVKTIINGHRYTSSMWFSFDGDLND